MSRFLKARRIVRQVDRPAVGGFGVYDGMEQTLAHLADVWAREGPFEGVFGFSLGAVVGACFLAHPDYRHLTASAKFACFVAGGLPRDPAYAALLPSDAPLDLPSLHVYGEADEIVEPPRSLGLAAAFRSPTVFVHPGGHTIPSSGAKALRTFLDALDREPGAVSELQREESIGPAGSAESPEP